MGTISNINGIDEDDISHHNGATASLYANYNGDIWDHVPPYSFQGSNYGYVCGGNGPRDEIEKFQFATDNDAADVGNLTESGRCSSSGQSSGVHVYQAGGTDSLGTIIQQIAVASDGDAVDGGDITSTYNEDKSGNSSSTHGYTSCGYGSWSNPANDKFLFASGTNNAVDIGDPVSSRYSVSSQSSATTGYFCGGWYSGPAWAIIDRFEFASDGNCTDSGDLDEGMGSHSGQSSTTHGYSTCGHGTGVNDNRNHIKKFAFASGTQNSTDIGDMTVARRRVAGVSGVTHGYACGGYTSSAIDTTDKFSFSSDGNGTDVLNLATARDYVGGTQY